jgi:GYF domain 2
MQIHIARSGQQLGPFSVEEINRKLADGTLSAADQAWYEGAAGWAPLSSVPGVTMPGGPATPIPPPPTPPPAPTAPPARPPQISASTVPYQQPTQSYRGMVIVSWILLGFTFVISLVPILGCGSWILVWPVAVATLIMAIVVLTRGGKTQGIMLIIASILIVPLALVAPVVSTAVLGVSINEREAAQEKLIMENLQALSDAKGRWVAQTKVAGGAKVTVAGLALYLNGKEIKSIVGETYDPRPVGEEPAATLPSARSLASHKKGAVITVGGFSPTTERSPSSDLKTDDAPSPAATPEEL